MEKLKKGDRVEWLLGSGSLWVEKKGYRALSDEDKDGVFMVESEEGPQSCVSSAPSLWRRLPREAICGAGLGVDGCVKCKPALTVPRRARSVEDLRPGMRVRVEHPDFGVIEKDIEVSAVDGRYPSFGGVFRREDVCAWATVTIIADAPAAVEAPKPVVRTFSSESGPAEKPAARGCDPRCTVGAPCTRNGAALCANARKAEVMEARATAKRDALNERDDAKAIDTAAPDPLAAYLRGNGVCVMRGRRGL